MHEREGRAERVMIEALTYREESGVARPGLGFTFYNFRNDVIAEVEFGATYEMLLGFVESVARVADRSTTLAMADNDRQQADAN